VAVLARGHLHVGRTAAARLAVRPQTPFEIFGQRLIDDAGGRLAQCPRQVFERLLELARDLDGWRRGRVGHGGP
jgi:hypothetical protein